MKTYRDHKGKFEYSDETYHYQHELTLKLDGTQNTNADQELINEFVLWKVNRYVKMKPATLKMLNDPIIKRNKINEEFTKDILKLLLDTPGIGLPMASTFLSFLNPNIYQIIDRRAYRYIGYTEKPPTNLDEQINLYLQYLKELRKISNDNGFAFSKAGRIFYQCDKSENRTLDPKVLFSTKKKKE